MNNTKKTDAEKQLIKFDKEFSKLLAKYPEIFVAGDVNGGIVASFTPNEPWAKTLSTKLPSFAKRVQA
jgi:hypothetical protein